MAVIYTVTIFISAFLLFLIQPIMAKVLLPYLGGGPAVWNTAMVFYQGVLLAGYFYAFLLSRWLTPVKQVTVHFLLLALSLTFLPVALREYVGSEAALEPVFWLFMTLTFSIGLPFFLLSANAPLLQHWFSRLPHPHAKNPYFMYSASNFGSFLALLSYPVILQPLFTIPQQKSLWSWGYGLFFLMLVIGSWVLIKHTLAGAKRMEGDMSGNEHPEAPPTAGKRLLWVGLAFVPSSLLLGITSYITMDMAPTPLFWVIPLAIYLLTFVLAFHPKCLFYRYTAEAQVLLVTIVVLLLAFVPSVFSLVFIHLVAFFVIALMCHGSLAKHRPSAEHLTEFYLWISLGGVLGGMANALLAPVVFTNIIEYPLMLCIACLCRFAYRGEIKINRWSPGKDLLWPAVYFALLLAALYAVKFIYSFSQGSERGIGEQILVYAMIVLFVFGTIFYAYFARLYPVRLAGLMAAMLLCGGAAKYIIVDNQTFVHAERNFFGVLRVAFNEENNTYALFHGTTNHGMQSLDPEYRLHPVTYYRKLREVVEEIPESLTNEPVAVLGQGIGTVACLGTEKQRFDFYEIDPAVQRLAEDTRYFTYMRDCKPEKRVIIGDARMSIGKAPDASYGMIIIDIFTSDAIPVHLLTREALGTYLAKLKPDGVLAIHISNRHFKLAPVVSSLAADAGLQTMHVYDSEPEHPLARPSSWVALARNSESFGKLADESSGWAPLSPSDMAVWTDHYVNILAALK